MKKYATARYYLRRTDYLQVLRRRNKLIRRRTDYRAANTALGQLPKYPVGL